MAILCLACLPALAQQHAQVGPQVLTIPTGQPPGQPITIKVPNSAQLFALQSFFTGAYPKGGTRNSLDPSTVTWVSSNPAAAIMNTSGILTAVGAGSTIITATYGRLTGTVQVTVTGMTSLTLNPPPPSSTFPNIPIGDLAQFTATAGYSDLSTQDVTNEVIWTSSQPTDIPITSGNPGGVVKVEKTATAGETANISCAFATLTCTGNPVTVTAAQAVVDLVVVTPHSAAVSGSLGPATYTADCIYSDGLSLTSAPAITCSGDANHAAITIGWTNGGSVMGDTGSALLTPSTGNTTTATALTNGTVTVVATPTPNNGQCVGAACKARLDVGLTAVNAISPASPTIPKGSTQQFLVTGNFSGLLVVSPQDITNYVTWSTANINPVTGVNIAINRLGLATALGPVGSTSTIFAGIDPCDATHVGNGFCQSTTAIVDPPNLVSIAITPATSPTSLAMGAKRQFTATGTYTDKSTANITNSVSWISSDTTKAAFSATKPGQLIANSTTQGPTNIKATCGPSPQCSPVVTSNTVAVNITQAVLSSITVTPKNPSVPTGTTNFQFTATGKYSDGTTQQLPYNGDANHVAATSLTWSSSAPNAATIDSSTGMADVIGTSGTTSIKATSGTIVGSTVLTVAPAAIKSIAITPNNNPSVAQNDTQQFTATGTFTDNSQKDVTADVTWSETDSSGGGNATISNGSGSEGLATAVNQGTATIIATDPVPNVTSSVQMTITARALTSIAVTPASATINAGSTQQFTATGTYNAPPTTQDITSSVTWASDNTAVATIDASGLATGASAGTANITATQGSVVSSPATLTVSNPILQSITITPNGNNVIAHINQTLQFTATGNYSDGSTQDLSAIATWSLLKNLGDSIDATGLYTAGKTAGSQTVTANCNAGQCGTGSATASQAFTVTF
jgi:hypothetical protein